MRRKQWLSVVFFMGCGVQTPGADADRNDPAPQGEPAAPQGEPAAPQGEPAAPQGEPAAPQGEPLELPDDQHCAHRRLAQPEANSAGDPTGNSITEHLDGEGCVAVRSTQTVTGRTTRIEVEVPGDPQWFAQPPAYVDLTPRPLVTTVTVDAQGREIEQTIDQGADGSIDERVRQVWEGERLIAVIREGPQPWSQRWAHDDRGNEVRVQYENADGLTVIERTFDMQDRKRVERTLRDGVLALTRTWRYVGEHLVEERSASDAQVESTVYVRDPDGTLRRREWRRERPGQSVIIERHDFTESATGEITEHYRRDDQDDGVIEAQRWSTKDRLGNVLRVAHDDNADGIIEWARSHRWDELGRMIWWRNTQNDAPILLKTWAFAETAEHTIWPAPGGLPGTWINRAWQEDEDHITEVFIENRIERLLSRTVTRYVTPDVIGEQTMDTDGDGEVDRHLRQTVDALGRVTRIESTRDGVDRWRAFEFDHHGELAIETGTPRPGEEPRLIRRYVRDLAGNVVYSYDLMPDGAAAFRVVYALLSDGSP